MIRLDAAIEGALGGYLRGQAAGVVKAVRSATAEETEATKARVRGLVTAAFPAGTNPRTGKGRRAIGNAIRSKLYNDAAGSAGGVELLKASTGLVYSKLGRRQGGRFVDYLQPFTTGATIRPTRGKYMIIPTGGVSRRISAVKRSLDQLGTDPRLALIPLPGGRLLFVRKVGTKKDGTYRASSRSTVLAVLIRRATLPKKLDVGIARTEAFRRLADNLAGKLGDLK